MSRRIAGLFVTLCELPWWTSGVTGCLVYLIIGQGLPALTHDQANLGPVINTLQPYAGSLAIVLLLTALLSLGHSLSRRLLLDRQTSLKSIRAMSWRDFEKLCGEAFHRRGYHIHENGLDSDINLVLKRAGEITLVQCKRWKTFKIGLTEVRELYGLVRAERADRGILVTSGAYSAEARAFAKDKPLTLYDGKALLDLIQGVQRHPAERHSPWHVLDSQVGKDHTPSARPTTSTAMPMNTTPTLPVS
jgi:restriction system protein